MSGSSTWLRRLCAGAIAALGLALLPVGVSAAATPINGTATDRYGLSFTYKIEVPSPWNGTLVLYSHGYTFGPDNPAEDVGDPTTGAWLLANGYALAGSSYSTTGWALQQAFPYQPQLLNLFNTKLSLPTP